MYSLSNFKAAYNSDPADLKTAQYIGKTYYYLKDYEKSIFYFETTLKLLQTNNILLYNLYEDLALTFYADNQYKKAIEMFNKKFEIVKYKSFNDYYNLAVIYDKSKNMKLALKNYEQFLDVYGKYKIDFSKDKKYKFVENRITKIKEKLHFEGKLTN